MVTNTKMGDAILVGNHAWTFTSELPPGASNSLYKFQCRVVDAAGVAHGNAFSAQYTVTGPVTYPTPTGSGSLQRITLGMTQAQIDTTITNAGVGGVVKVQVGTYANRQVKPLDSQYILSEYGGRAVFTGSIPITGWTADQNWFKATGFPFPPLYSSNGSEDDWGVRGLTTVYQNDLYWNGVAYERVTSKFDLGPKKFWVDPVAVSGIYTVWISDDPTGVTTTAGNLEWAFMGGDGTLSYPIANSVTLQDIDIKEYASVRNRGAITVIGDGTTIPNAWRLNNCNVNWNHACGFSGGVVHIMGGNYDNNGQLGITSWGVSTSSLSGTSLNGISCSNNNYARYSYGNGAGGFKSLYVENIDIRYSKFSKNYGPGIWYDTECTGQVSYSSSCHNEGKGFHQEATTGATFSTAVIYNLFDRNNEDHLSNTISGLQGCSVYSVSSNRFIARKNVIIAYHDQGAIGFEPDYRNTNPNGVSIGGATFGNTIIGLGRNIQGGYADTGHTNTWDYNIYYSLNPLTYGYNSYSWGGTTFTDYPSPGSNPIDNHATYNYSDNPLDAYYQSFSGVSITSQTVEINIPEGSGTTTISGIFTINGTYTGPAGCRIEVWKQTP